MSSGINLLKSKKISELHDDTHISVKNLENLLNYSFDNIKKVHFVGFIKVLEEKYKIDLSEYKSEGLSFYEEQLSRDDKHELFVRVPQNSSKKNVVAITSVIILFALFILFQIYNKAPSQSAQVVENINNTEINKALEKIDLKKEQNSSEVLSTTSLDAIAEENLSAQKVDQNVEKGVLSHTLESVHDKNITAVPLKSTLDIAKKESDEKNSTNDLVKKSMVLVPKKDAWLGVIELKTLKKLHNKVIKGEYEIDNSKDLLIVVGHGDLAIKEGNSSREFKEPSRIRFLVKDSKIEKIDLEKFKELNQGQAW